MNPDRRTVPHRGIESCFPYLGHPSGIEHAVYACDCGTRVGISECQWCAAAEIVRPSGWPTYGTDLLQGGYEMG